MARSGGIDCNKATRYLWPIRSEYVGMVLESIWSHRSRRLMLDRLEQAAGQLVCTDYSLSASSNDLGASLNDLDASSNWMVIGQ